MKQKLFTFLTLCVLLVACNETDQCLPTVNTICNDIEYTSAEIISIANEIADELYCPTSRTQKRTANTYEIYDYNTGKSRSESSNLRIVNYNDDNGFVVISKYRSSTPVIAVINEGHYDPDTKIDNPGFNMYMSLAEIYVGRFYN